MQGKKKNLYIVVSGITLVLTIGAALGALFLFSHSGIPTAKAAASPPMHVSCGVRVWQCVDVGESDEIFGAYKGHDEPALLFYSNKPGSGNRAQFNLTLPKDPAAANPLTPGKSFNFQLHVTFWFSEILCDTQSYPEQVHTPCKPDSDTNIVDPTVSTKHAGTAVMELQFYPPGWVKWPAGANCDARKWCSALNIDSLSVDPIAGTLNNPTCLAAAGEEPVNFAFVTKSGHPHAPPSPLLSTLDTFTPNPATDLFMNSGDKIVVTMHDSPHGLFIEENDTTTHQMGTMTASAANGFGQVLFDPAGANCDPATHNIPYDFHPMYSTSSEKTGAIWPVHTLGLAFSDEIGHFEICQGPNAITPNGGCPMGNTEGNANDTEPSDADDTNCFPASSSSLVQMGGCLEFGGNAGFDGPPYQTDWPDGNTALHPTAVQFSSPKTGPGFSTNYDRVAFESDTPALEASCNFRTGAGCSIIPQTDDAQSAAFYPFYSTRNLAGSGQCVWQIGNHIPGNKNDFGQNNEWGNLFGVNSYLFGGGGAPRTRFFVFRQILSSNPCKG